MVRIIKREFLGQQKVYDIGVVKDHNFLLKQGFIASNCFNKSHSTAYAYLTYQTAYLKANYPVEYMTALLTASSDNQDKIEKYRENCQKMGIEVEAPDINRSQKHFTPDGEKILFGLSAVRNLGEAAIENILQARERSSGQFKSLGDFCSSVDLRAVNRRALETLIFCGAFDSIKPNRQQLLNDLELVINWAQNRAKEKATGQTNIFDFIASNQLQTEGSFEQEPAAKSVEDFSLHERLRLEKENLGFYVSEHPLKSIHQSARLLSPINLNQLSEQKTRTKVSAIVIINSIKKIVTKKGEAMAFLQLEDVSGQAEAVIFPSVYTQLEIVLQANLPLIVWGKVEHKEEQSQLIIEDANPVENVKIVIVELSLEDALDNLKNSQIKAIIQEQSGDKTEARTPVIAKLSMGTETRLIRFGQDFWVQNGANLIESLTNAGFSAHIASLA
ncbi:hypothetical protein [Gloeocapsa sp. PCC 73106]|uniref:helix-hairpin-helix domain-containing protein n=1 Tax=Gloeocapsa sp. PCC 73106 TaxID=102232 RepID=UPI0002ABED7E|nr:hypothetical protein [Gloeocapsa sp. PCC 73106]ELS00094.1 hypothetical protein GLO73106DRAFT_00039490 [Gloeocapsa sp. PCC 73106]